MTKGGDASAGRSGGLQKGRLIYRPRGRPAAVKWELRPSANSPCATAPQAGNVSPAN